MKTKSRGRRTAKLVTVVVFSLIALAGLSKTAVRNGKVSASASGPTPSHTNAPGEANCTVCHGDFPVNSGTGSITISGIPANYKPNEVRTITVTTSQSDAVIYGFQLTALDSTGGNGGTFTLPVQNPAQMQIVHGLVDNVFRSYAEHTVDGIIPTQFGSKTWTLTWTAPSQRKGRIGFYAAGNSADSDGSPSGDYIYTRSEDTLSGSAVASFEGDSKTDISVYRPSNGVWYSQNSSDFNYQSVLFGIAEDRVVAGDYDGDGITDRAVWRPSTGFWHVLKSGGGTISAPFGASTDIPVPGDYDGDLKTDLAVWRPSTGQWFIFRSSDSNYEFRTFGIGPDKPVPGDYDGDAITDIAVWRPSNGVWYIWRSTDFGFNIFAFGQDLDQPVQGDYDGDGRADAAVFRPADGVWYLLRSTQGFGAAQFGFGTDKPVPGDFDGDGKTDIAVFRDGIWYALRSSDFNVLGTVFGQAGDIPVPRGYIPQ